MLFRSHFDTRQNNRVLRSWGERLVRAHVAASHPLSVPITTLAAASSSHFRRSFHAKESASFQRDRSVARGGERGSSEHRLGCECDYGCRGALKARPLHSWRFGGLTSSSIRVGNPVTHQRQGGRFEARSLSCVTYPSRPSIGMILTSADSKSAT